MKNHKLFFLLVFPLLLSAHKVNLFGELSGQELYINGYFAGGGACKSCQVIIFDSQNNEIAREQLDEMGEGTFEIPLQDWVTVELDASLGHKNTLEIQNTMTRKQADANVPSPTENLPQQANQAKTESVKLEHESFEWQKFFCGVGYLFGFFGVLMLFKRKK